MIPRQTRKVLQDLVLGHPTSEVFQDVSGSDARADQARLATTYAGVTSMNLVQSIALSATTTVRYDILPALSNDC